MGLKLLTTWMRMQTPCICSDGRANGPRSRWKYNIKTHLAVICIRT